LNYLKYTALMILLSLSALVELACRARPREIDDEWRID
jgi:hypothetical protein